MSVILGTTPPKPALAHNATGHRPPPIDSRTPGGGRGLPTDVAALQTMKANVDARLMAAEIVAAGGVGPGITVDDLARLGASRLRELKAKAGMHATNAQASDSLADTFLRHRLQHEAAP
jgi:hypothetical protein